jgi:xanthine/uracil permease
MNNLYDTYLAKHLEKLSVDQKMWGGIAVFSLIMVILFSLFTTGGASVVALKIGVGLLEMFVPGYIIVKLYMNDVKISESQALDRFILSLGMSFATVQVLSFITEYITVFGLNEDQDERISRENYKSLIIVALVIGTAFGVKYLPTYFPQFMEKWKKKETNDTSGS